MTITRRVRRWGGGGCFGGVLGVKPPSICLFLFFAKGGGGGGGGRGVCLLSKT